MSDSEIALGIVRRQNEMGIHVRVKPGPADSSIFDEVNGDSPARVQSRHGVRWAKADKAPGTRIRRWQLMRNRFINAAKRNGEPGMWIFNTCDQFKRTVPVLPRDQKKLDDIDTDAEDHVGDESGYRVLDGVGARGAMSINAGHATNA